MFVPLFAAWTTLGLWVVYHLPRYAHVAHAHGDFGSFRLSEGQLLGVMVAAVVLYWLMVSTVVFRRTMLRVYQV